MPVNEYNHKPGDSDQKAHDWHEKLKDTVSGIAKSVREVTDAVSLSRENRKPEGVPGHSSESEQLKKVEYE